MRRSTDSLPAPFLLLLVRMTQCGIHHGVGLAVPGKSDRRIVMLQSSVAACGNLRRSQAILTINTSDSADQFACWNALYGGLGMIN